ncbi:hypothetical protein GCM10020220_040820 [Nonomuraea rubra]
MTAMPGTFCAAMVTRNSGMAMLTTADRLSAGAVSSTAGRSAAPDRPPPFPCTAMATTATASAQGTAHRRWYRCSTAQVSTTGTASIGTSTTARTGAVHRLRMTPASMAAAIGRGMAAIARAGQGDRPASTSNPAQTMNAPTAAGNPPGTGPVAISSAAPGVDQAMLIGMRYRSPRKIAAAPTPQHRASSPDAACPGVAPTARSPASTTVNELA